jgi:hypothetical protein
VQQAYSIALDLAGEALEVLPRLRDVARGILVIVKRTVDLRRTGRDRRPELLKDRLDPEPS